MEARLPKHARWPWTRCIGALLTVIAIASAAVAASPRPEARTLAFPTASGFTLRRAVPPSRSDGASGAGVLSDDGFAARRLFAPGQRLAVAGVVRSADAPHPARRTPAAALLFGAGGALVAVGAAQMMRQRRRLG